jgi:hypothetical protein
VERFGPRLQDVAQQRACFCAAVQLWLCRHARCCVGPS